MLLLFICAATLYAQKPTASDYESKIELAHPEIGPSAILNFSFLEPKTIKYSVTLNNREVLSEEVTKMEGAQSMKRDFSSLENGSYAIHFIIDGVEVKTIPFRKI